MSENQTATDGGYEWRAWKVAVVGLAGLLVVVGAAIGYLSDEPDSGSSTTNVATGSGDRAGSGSGGADPISTPGVEGFGPSVPVSPGGTPGGTDPSPGPTPGATPGAATEGGDATSAPIDWSPALLRGGFSFLVAFAVAYALRTFMRIAIFFLGVWGASMFLLANLGWIDVHWDAIDAAFSGWASGIGDQFESFGRLVTGSLPATGLAGLGFYTGIRRK